jgi:tetratricopeptide (TPR) repeat protein
MKRFLSVLFLLSLLTAPEARGDQKDPRLDGLFEELQALEDSQVAQAVELQIWQLWTQSRNAAVNLLMRTGISAMERQDYAAALISFDRITGMEPDFAEGWNKRATLLYYLGDYSGSLTDIDKTLALEPRHFGAYSGRGLVFMKLERYDLARQAFEKALEINPHSNGAKRYLEEVMLKLEKNRI